MDCSWLMEDDVNEDPGSEADSEEAQAELETRLYSIVHHSDLSQPLPPELAKHYSVQCGDDGKLTVALNDTLENIKSEEEKKVDHLVRGSEPVIEVSEVLEIEHSPEKDDVILISNNECNSEKSAHKRLRYSDVNIDLSNGPVNVNESLSSDIDYSDLNYFKITPSFFKNKKVKKLKDLVIPASFQVAQHTNWKDAANESFISVGADTSGSEKEIIDEMFSALNKANPTISKKKLYFVARALFIHNRRQHRKRKRRKLNKAKIIDDSLNSSLKGHNTFINHDINSSLELKSTFISHESKETFVEHSGSIKNNSIKILDGSISLNISPFKPLPQSQSGGVSIVDLVSEDEVEPSNDSSQQSTIKWKSLPRCEIPRKWTKKMIKFYVKPSDRKLEMELDDIFQDLKRNSTVDEWRVDPRDEIGVYQRTPLKGKYRNRKCPNCNQRGHLLHECPSPRKVPTCTLCGMSYHSAFTCPNKICLKCGVYVKNEAFECTSCYFNTFNDDNPCGVCGQIAHRSEICPDLWRSYHATVEGEKKIPKYIKENKRKYCCNCSSKGHFSHQCPFLCNGEQISSFVTNYSASSFSHGTTEVVVPRHLSHLMDSEDADIFLQRLSNSSNAIIDVDSGQPDYVFRIRGTFAQCRKARNEIEEYVNILKRKREEPHPKKKRRRLR